MAERKRPGIVVYIVAMICLLFAYPLSFGPLIFLQKHDLFPVWAAGPSMIYCYPYYALWMHVANPDAPQPFFVPLLQTWEWYLNLWR